MLFVILWVRIAINLEMVSSCNLSISLFTLFIISFDLIMFCFFFFHSAPMLSLNIAELVVAISISIKVFKFLSLTLAKFSRCLSKNLMLSSKKVTTRYICPQYSKSSTGSNDPILLETVPERNFSWSHQLYASALDNTTRLTLGLSLSGFISMILAPASLGRHQGSLGLTDLGRWTLRFIDLFP